MNKALLPLLLCCFIFPASGKDAGWQWYNEKINPKEKENKPVPAAPRQEPDIMQKLAALQTATKRALYEAILYPGVDNFVKYFRLQNYWTQQAGLFTMSAKKAMLAHPELDYNLQYSHYNGTVRNQLAADQAQQRQAIAKLAEHYGIMFFYRGQDPIDGQLAQVINGFRDTYGLSVIPVSVDGVINPLLPDSRTDQGQAQRLGVKYFPAMMLFNRRTDSILFTLLENGHEPKNIGFQLFDTRQLGSQSIQCLRFTEECRIGFINHHSVCSNVICGRRHVRIIIRTASGKAQQQKAGAQNLKDILYSHIYLIN